MVVFLSKPIYNKWYAQVRLIDSKRANSLMKDLFFDLDTWPKHLIEIFVTPVTRIGYHDRYMRFKIYMSYTKNKCSFDSILQTKNCNIFHRKRALCTQRGEFVH